MGKYFTSTTKGTKQRKAIANAPSHIRGRMMSAALSKDLRTQYSGVRSLPVQTGDEVEVTTGQFKGRKGTVKSVYRLRMQVFIERLERENARGKTVGIPFDASNLRITKLNMTKSRSAFLSRKKGGSVQV